MTTTPANRVAITRAIISVYDKTGLDQLARDLHRAGVEIVSTGSTAAAIRAAGVPVTPVEVVTGFGECLDGRVKTLHPAIHAGLLADLREPSHRSQLDQLQISPFQLLVSNLYPFTETVASGASPQECVEQVDIGGPAMVRAAAKNHANVAVITSPDAYGLVAAAIKAGGFTLEERRTLAAQAFAHTARYDAAVASWFASVYAPDEVAAETGWPDLTAAVWDRREVLRYGENPHQRAALYVAADDGGPGASGPRRRPGDGRGGGSRTAPRQGHVVQQLRGRRCRLAHGGRVRRGLRRHHETRQPMRYRSRRRHRRGAPQGQRVRSRISVRRGNRREPARHG